MNISPEERPKLLVLSAGIVVMIGVFCVTVVPRLLPHGPNGELLVGSNSTGSSTPPTVVGAHPTPTVLPNGISNSATNTAAVAEAVTPVPPSTAPDPFWRPLALSLLPPKMTATPVRRPEPSLSVTATPGFRSRSGSGKLAPIPPPPLPEVELQGIVQDETSMAVLAIGGQVRFLKAGEFLEGGWILFRIQTGAVVLRQGRREIVLTLGQTHQKETPKEMPLDHQDARGIAETLPSFHNVTLVP